MDECKPWAGGWLYNGNHLDMFWTFGADGKSYLDEKLKVKRCTLTLSNPR